MEGTRAYRQIPLPLCTGPLEWRSGHMCWSRTMPTHTVQRPVEARHCYFVSIKRKRASAWELLLMRGKGPQNIFRQRDAYKSIAFSFVKNVVPSPHSPTFQLSSRPNYHSNMSFTGAIITAFGQGSVEITFYDNGKAPVDSQTLDGQHRNGSYKWSVNPLHISGLQKYAFSLKNNGFLVLQVNWKGQTHNLTAGANTIAFDLWNSASFVPTNTAAPPAQHVGGVTLLEQP
ncbi:unnamed protein product [Mortierella alpina]